MEKIVLKAEKRTVVGKQVRALRRAGKLPAVIYGHRIDPLAITLEAHESNMTLSRAASTALITIAVGGKEYPCLVREKQRNYIKGGLIHVDFQAVSLTEKISANVAVELDGESPAVKNFDAVLVQSLAEIEVEALPTDLPESFVVDISKLVEVGDQILVKDLAVPDKVEILTDLDEVVVVATAPKVTEEVEEAEAGEEPEVIERGKKEEEEE
ncbi:MAG: 50S ribosomal protein L25 [Chloroflexota bacterium]